MTFDTEENTEVVMAITSAFCSALVTAAINNEELLAGFLAGRYVLRVEHNGLTVLEAPQDPEGLSALLEGEGDDA